MSLKRIGDIEIDEDIEWERKEWTVERVGWVIMALIVLLALIGLFGEGPISKRTAGEEGGAVWIDYHRFSRYKSPETIVVHLSPETVVDGEVRLVAEGDFTREYRVERIAPEPDGIEIGSDRFIYTWPAPQADGVMHITFHVEANGFWEMNSRFGPENGSLLAVDQFIYP